MLRKEIIARLKALYSDEWEAMSLHVCNCETDELVGLALGLAEYFKEELNK